MFFNEGSLVGFFMQRMVFVEFILIHSLCPCVQRIMADGREAPMTTKLTGAAEAVVKRKVQVILSFGSRPRLRGGCKFARTRSWPGQCLQALISRHTLQGPQARMTVFLWMSRPSSKSICLLLQTRCYAIMYSSWWAIGRAPARFLSTSR